MIFLKKLFVAFIGMVTLSFYAQPMQELSIDGKDSEVQALNEKSTKVVHGAVYYVVHGDSYCDRHGWGRNLVRSSECSEIDIVAHSPYSMMHKTSVSLHDKNWNVLACGDFELTPYETELHVEKYLLDHSVKPQARYAEIFEGLCERYIIFYDQRGVVLFNALYTGSCDLTAEDRMQFENKLDFTCPLTVYYNNVSLLTSFKAAFERLILR